MPLFCTVAIRLHHHNTTVNRPHASLSIKGIYTSGFNNKSVSGFKTHTRMHTHTITMERMQQRTSRIRIFHILIFPSHLPFTGVCYANKPSHSRVITMLSKGCQAVGLEWVMGVRSPSVVHDMTGAAGVLVKRTAFWQRAEEPSVAAHLTTPAQETTLSLADCIPHVKSHHVCQVPHTLWLWGFVEINLK